MKSVLISIFLLTLSSCSLEKLYSLRQQRTLSSFEQLNFVELTRKYIDKQKADPANLEGIYSVTSIVMKKSKGLFATEERERVIDQKDHYAQVAVIRDNSRNNREYIEVPVDKTTNATYSVRGEFTTMSEGNILVLKHFEPKGKVLNYAFTYDHDKDILEGIRTETSGSVTYTYKLIFVRLYPKKA